MECFDLPPSGWLDRQPISISAVDTMYRHFFAGRRGLQNHWVSRGVVGCSTVEQPIGGLEAHAWRCSTYEKGACEALRQLHYIT